MPSVVWDLKLPSQMRSGVWQCCARLWAAGGDEAAQHKAKEATAAQC
uniref:Uncharacterized protein n=1 Tax=Fagus sylvatica TaxID=28930 RepID=A0A2N9EYU4_FAGSY